MEYLIGFIVGAITIAIVDGLTSTHYYRLYKDAIQQHLDKQYQSYR